MTDQEIIASYEKAVTNVLNEARDEIIAIERKEQPVRVPETESKIAALRRQLGI